MQEVGVDGLSPSLVDFAGGYKFGGFMDASVLGKGGSREGKHS